jgi:hypothetical protein
MKHLLILLLAATACTKQTTPPAPKKPGIYRVLAIGNDTTVSKQIVMRENADPYLIIEYMGYSNGKLKIQVINNQSCEADILFNFSDYPVSSISPNPKNNLHQNHIGTGNTVFELTAPAQAGILHVKALSVCVWQGPPTWVDLDITLKLLPIKFEYFRGADGSRLEWKVDAPQDVDRFEVQEYTGEWVTRGIVFSDGIRKEYSLTLKD